MIVQYRLECEHVFAKHISEIQEREKCKYCKRWRKVKAIETREWYFKCGQCNYARYNGQSKSSANTLLSVHQIHAGHHGGNVWYRRHPQKSDTVKRVFGRKVRDTFADDNKIYPDEKLPLKLMDREIQEVILPDKPNF